MILELQNAILEMIASGYALDALFDGRKSHTWCYGHSLEVQWHQLINVGGAIAAKVLFRGR